MPESFKKEHIIHEDELVSTDTSPVTAEEMKAAVDALKYGTPGDTFENTHISKHIGVVEVSEESRVNIDKLKEKRDGYVLEAIKQVSYRSFIEKNREAMLREVRDQLYRDHGLDPKLVREDLNYVKENMRMIQELIDTYPEDLLRDSIKEFQNSYRMPEERED